LGVASAFHADSFVVFEVAVKGIFEISCQNYWFSKR